jgi:hypothetical protein
MSATPMRPETRYASSPEGYVAYHVFGAGPPDLLFLAHYTGESAWSLYPLHRQEFMIVSL